MQRPTQTKTLKSPVYKALSRFFLLFALFYIRKDIYRVIFIHLFYYLRLSYISQENRKAGIRQPPATQSTLPLAGAQLGADR